MRPDNPSRSNGIRPHFRDQVARIDRLLDLVRSGDITPVRGVLTYHDLLVLTCQSIAGLAYWLEADPAFLPASWHTVRCDIQRDPALGMCARVATGRSALVLTQPRLPGGTVSRTRARTDASGVQYYVDASDATNPYSGAEIDVVLTDAREAWRRIIDAHWLEGMRF